MCVCDDYEWFLLHCTSFIDISVLLLYVSAYIDVCYWLAIVLELIIHTYILYIVVFFTAWKCSAGKQ